MLVFETLKNKISDFLNSNTWFCSRLYGICICSIHSIFQVISLKCLCSNPFSLIRECFFDFCHYVHDLIDGTMDSNKENQFGVTEAVCNWHFSRFITNIFKIFASTQCARTDLNKRFLPKPMTTTGWKGTP